MKKSVTIFTVCLLALPALALQTSAHAEDETVIVGGGSGSVSKPPAGHNQVIIKRVEKIGDTGSSTEKVPWLGVSTEEISETLASQLKLTQGEGLVITHVAEKSPAEKAGLQKHDVLVSFDKQLLVVPDQLRKLVRTRKADDTVQLTYLRGGERHTTEASLVLAEQAVAESIDEFKPDQWIDTLRQSPQFKQGVRQLQNFGKSMADGNVKIQAEVRRSIEEARQAIQEALRNASNSTTSQVLRDLARSGAVLGDNSSVTVKSQSSASRTMVKTDISGNYVLTANPKKHLTAHDKDGKLLFDGPIETAEEQSKVPRPVWEQVAPMVEQLDKMAPHSLEDVKPEVN